MKREYKTLVVEIPSAPSPGPAIMDAAQAAAHLPDMIGGVEVAAVLTLTAAHTLIGAHIISVGTVNQTIMSARDVFRHALMDGASSVIVAHTHPSGNGEPSQADADNAAAMAKAGRIIDITVLDSLVITSTGVTSLRTVNPDCWRA